MNVLICPSHPFLDQSYGGEASWACNVISLLAEKPDMQITAVCGINRTRFRDNVKVIEVGFDKGDLFNRGLFYYSFYEAGKRILKNYDLFHHMFPFGFKAGLSPLAVTRHLRGVPFIIGPIQYPQELSDLTDYIWTSGRRGLYAKIMYSVEKIMSKSILKSMDFFHEASLREAEALIFDSEKALRLYSAMYPDTLKNKISQVTPPGIETEFFRYTPPIKKNYFEIMTAGYLLRRKGIQYLIGALPYVMKEFRNVRLRIIGEGPYKETLERQVRQLSLSKLVAFEGRIPRVMMRDYYASCDVYVHPSLSETFPSVVREAMAAGRPVLVTDVGFVREHILDGMTGFVIPKASVTSIVDGLKRLIGDEELRHRIGLNAHEYAIRSFNWRSIVDKWYETYAKLVES
jgi:glycosyltransferase involved in cell wall biosynthesis